MHHPTDRIAHTTAFVTPVMEHWLEQEIILSRENYIREAYRQLNNIKCNMKL